MIKKITLFFSLFMIVAFLFTACNLPGGSSPAEPTMLPGVTSAPDQPTNAPDNPPQAAEPTAAGSSTLETQGPAPTKVVNTKGAVALKIDGEVTNQISWSLEDLGRMPNIQVQWDSSKATPQTDKGVKVIDLLKKAMPTSRAEKVVFVGGGGSKVEFPIAQIESCQECIVFLRGKADKTGLGLLLPGLGKGVVMKDVLEIQVKGNGIP